MAILGVTWVRCGVAAVAIAGVAALPACGSEKRDGILGRADAGTSPGPGAGGPQGGGGKPSAACPPLAVNADLRGVFAVADNDVWAVGDAGTVLHYDGCWRAEPKATDVDLYTVWASADGTVWVGGASATTLRRSAGAWSLLATPGTSAVRGIFATATIMWAAAEEGAIYRSDGGAWQVSHVNSTAGTYHGVWGAAPDDVWVVGDGQEPDGDRAAIHVHWNGAAWTESYSCNPDGNRYAAGGWIAVLDDIWGISADTVWDAGECDPGGGFVRAALIERLLGGAWPEIDLGTLGDHHPVDTLWASSEHDVWAASHGNTSEGHGPVMLHFDGIAWTASSDPVTAGILRIRGTSADDVWAVGTGGKRLHFDGATWTPSP